MMYQIDEVAKKTGLTKRALRYYEELGLVTPSGRTEGGYRLYTEQDIQQILHLKNLRDLLGISLAEIKELMILEKKYQELKENYFQKNSISERLELLKQLEETLNIQQKQLQEKVEKMTRMIQENNQKLKRIQTKRKELERGV
ncbi:MerR family transcriptional regulator [Thermoflavimicrobium dichotomicum]|uniref:DNA-binding transcriptional regulator, MerR family n=1 Tax=Thermoflavimicrobium dichotomicum TaxID=46223 RepID=A0A1I3UND0_9BACL|nr:MerR family transcriptional regulator [Thermoflavimicrobium dichotomicum]SFJ84435.1 DNA-binding transcriptional regulator, MerR family [Thermoflavimicrobium dichotomicum]